MRVLFGWEFGAGLGHVTRFRPIGDRLIEQGAEVVVALQDVDRVSPFLDPATGRARPGYRVLQAPRWNIPSDPAIRRIPTHSFADVLRLIGFGQPGALARRLAAWDSLIDLADPDVVIGDFAPSLALAARGRLPSVMIGNGYTIPPPGRPMPPIRPWQEQLEEFSVRHERDLLAAVNGALAPRGVSPVEHLADALHGDETYVFSLPLVDPYARFRTTPTLPPFNLPVGVQPKDWDARRPKGVFAYLPRAHKHAGAVLDAVAAAGVDGEAYISDMPASAARDLQRPGLTMHIAPQDFATVMPSMRLVIHHGGLSTAVAAVLAGTPQMILPWNLEHLVTARALDAAGGATVVPEERSEPGPMSRAIRNLVADRKRAERAAALAAGLDLGDPQAGVRTVVDRVLALGPRGDG